MRKRQGADRVVGTSGSGKTALARALAAEPVLPRIKLDALHWEGGRRPLTQTDPGEFVPRVLAAEAWAPAPIRQALISPVLVEIIGVLGPADGQGSP